MHTFHCDCHRSRRFQFVSSSIKTTMMFISRIFTITRRQKAPICLFLKRRFSWSKNKDAAPQTPCFTFGIFKWVSRMTKSMFPLVSYSSSCRRRCTFDQCRVTANLFIVKSTLSVYSTHRHIKANVHQVDLYHNLTHQLSMMLSPCTRWHEILTYAKRE